MNKGKPPAHAKNGYLLLDLLLNMSIILIISSCIFTGFVLVNKLHYRTINFIAMQSQLIFVMDNITRDIAYAENCRVQENSLIITTAHDQPKQSKKNFSYTVLKGRITRDNQPMTGDEAKNNILIEKFICTMPTPNLVIIKIQAIEQTTGKRFMLDTAAAIGYKKLANKDIKSF